MFHVLSVTCIVKIKEHLSALATLFAHMFFMCYRLNLILVLLYNLNVSQNNKQREIADFNILIKVNRE